MFTWMIQAHHIDGLVQDCSNPSALAMELLQSCTKPLISYIVYRKMFHYSNQAVLPPSTLYCEWGWGGIIWKFLGLIPLCIIVWYQVSWVFFHKDCIGINFVINAPADFQHLALTVHQQSQCWEWRYCFLQVSLNSYWFQMHFPDQTIFKMAR